MSKWPRVKIALGQNIIELSVYLRQEHMVCKHRPDHSEHLQQE